MQYERFLLLLEKRNHELADNLRLLPFPQDEWSFLRVSELLKHSLPKDDFYLCLDDAQEMNDNPAFSFFLKSLEKEKIPSLHLIIITRELPPLAIENARLKGEIGVIDGKSLALNENEAKEYLHFRGLDLGEGLVKKIYLKSEGWIAALELYAINIRETGSVLKEEGINALFKESFYASLNEKERTTLTRLSPFEEFSLPFANEASGSSLAVPLIERLHKSNSFVDETGGIYRFHSLLRDFLLENCPHDEEEKAVYRRASLFLLEKNDPSEPFYLEWFEKGDCLDELFEKLNSPLTPRWKFSSIEDIVHSLSKLGEDGFKKYPYAYLRCLFYFFLLGERESLTYAKALYDVMEDYYDDKKHKDIAAELLLIKRMFFQEPSSDGIDPLYKIGRDLYPRETFLLQKQDPFTYGLPMLLQSEYFEAGELDKDLKRLSDNAYERVLHGFGRGSEALSKAEGALLCGDLSAVPPLVRQSQSEAAKEGQFCILIAGEFVLMRRDLFYNDILTAKKRLERMKEHVSASLSLRFSSLAGRRIILEQYWLASSFYGSFAHEKERIPSDVLLGEEKDHLLYDGLGTVKSYEAIAMYSFSDYAGASAVSSRLLEEKNVSLLAYIEGLLIQGLCLERLQGKGEGWPLLKKAFLLGEKDRLIIPFAEYPELIPFIERFIYLKNGDASYRNKLLHEAVYHKSLLHEKKEGEASLSKREMTLLSYLKEGKSRQEMASLLYVTESTIKSELSSLYKKLGVHSRFQAVNRFPS